VSEASKWVLPVGRAVTLTAMVALAIVVALPAHRLPVVAALVVSVGGVAYGLRYGPDRWRQRLIGLILLAGGGVALILVDGRAPGWLACGAAIMAALARLPQRVALLFAIPVAAATCLAPLARGDRDEVPVMAAACGAALVLGLIIGDVHMRAVNAERLLAAEQAAQENRAQHDRLAERQRIAREIHDILAHTLSAQSVQLEGARLLVERGAPAGDVLPRIRTAQSLAREGLEETRRAVQSLRDELPPVERTVRRLADAAGAFFQQSGERAWPLEPSAALTIERTVQEGLTNARKHAPGAAVTVDLAYGKESVTVAISDTGSVCPPENAGGGGYGLAGMRERAALIGARLDSGAHGEGFRICLTVPR
jgi:signal transduction histidine kinase